MLGIVICFEVFPGHTVRYIQCHFTISLHHCLHRTADEHTVFGSASPHISLPRWPQLSFSSWNTPLPHVCLIPCSAAVARRPTQWTVCECVCFSFPCVSSATEPLLKHHWDFCFSCWVLLSQLRASVISVNQRKSPLAKHFFLNELLAGNTLNCVDSIFMRICMTNHFSSSKLINLMECFTNPQNISIKKNALIKWRPVQ